MIFKFKNKRGFTILESIVAIAILSLSISGAFSAVTQSLSQATIAKDEVKAFYLAQEATEILRSRVYSNQLDKMAGGVSNWLSGVPGVDTCELNKICQTDVVNMDIVKCSEGSTWGSDTCSYLKQDQNNFLYNQDPESGNNKITNFKREIMLESVTNDEIFVIVRVSWKKGVIEREFKVKALLFNWI
jgi:prepilin-type N-terminal cleavage/methylation domain-containing protein